MKYEIQFHGLWWYIKRKGMTYSNRPKVVNWTDLQYIIRKLTEKITQLEMPEGTLMVIRTVSE